MLTDASNPFDRSHAIGVLCDQITRMPGFNLTKGFLRLFFAFHGLQALFEELQVVALPHAANTGWRKKDALFAKFITGPNLAVGRIIEGHFYDRFFHLRGYSVFRKGLATADLAERLFTTHVIEFFDAVKAVAARAH